MDLHFRVSQVDPAEACHFLMVTVAVATVGGVNSRLLGALTLITCHLRVQTTCSSKRASFIASGSCSSSNLMTAAVAVTVSQ
jgi:hypothetical protein